MNKGKEILALLEHGSSVQEIEALGYNSHTIKGQYNRYIAKVKEKNQVHFIFYNDVIDKSLPKIKGKDVVDASLPKIKGAFNEKIGWE